MAKTKTSKGASSTTKTTRKVICNDDDDVVQSASSFSTTGPILYPEFIDCLTNLIYEHLDTENGSSITDIKNIITNGVGIFPWKMYASLSRTRRTSKIINSIYEFVARHYSVDWKKYSKENKVPPSKTTSYLYFQSISTVKEEGEQQEEVEVDDEENDEEEEVEDEIVDNKKRSKSIFSKKSSKLAALWKKVPTDQKAEYKIAAEEMNSMHEEIYKKFIVSKAWNLGIIMVAQALGFCTKYEVEPDEVVTGNQLVRILEILGLGGIPIANDDEACSIRNNFNNLDLSTTNSLLSDEECSFIMSGEEEDVTAAAAAAPKPVIIVNNKKKSSGAAAPPPVNKITATKSTKKVLAKAPANKKTSSSKKKAVVEKQLEEQEEEVEDQDDQEDNEVDDQAQQDVRTPMPKSLATKSTVPRGRRVPLK